MRDITEQDVKVFTDAVTDYFGALGDEPASIRTFYLACGEAKDVVGDLTGIITLSGDYRGAVYFAAPRSLIRSVLHKGCKRLRKQCFGVRRSFALDLLSYLDV